MPDLVHVFDHNGSTRGASGRPYKWATGQPVVAPEGEFEHLEAGTYQTRPLKPAGSASGKPELPPDPEAEAPADRAFDDGPKPAKSAPDRRISKGKGGWYTLLVDGEEAGKVQGEGAARHWQETGETPD